MSLKYTLASRTLLTAIIIRGQCFQRNMLNTIPTSIVTNDARRKGIKTMIIAACGLPPYNARKTPRTVTGTAQKRKQIYAASCAITLFFIEPLL
jgi:hypothetical protein